MNTKYLITSIPAAIVCSTAICSCGVQIQLASAMPAEVNFGRGSYLMFRSYTDSVEGESIRDYLWQLMEKDGYYSPCGRGYTSAKAVIQISAYITSQTHKTQNGTYTTYELHATVAIGNAYRRSFNTSVYKDSTGNLDTESKCRAIARAVMEDITPQSYTYYERVHGNDENPYVEQAAEQCAAGNWDKGKSLALKAIEKNPNEAEAYFTLGLYERNKMNYSKSNQYFKKAYEINQDSKYSEAIENNAILKKNEDAVRKQLNN